VPDDDDDWGKDPGRTENRSHPEGKARENEVFRESDGRKSWERREQEQQREDRGDRDHDD
jgi:hypothetical protein